MSFLSLIRASIPLKIVFRDICTYFLGHFGERFQFLRTHQLKFRYKVIKMLVTGIHVSLGANTDNSVKVMNIDMHEHSKKSRQDFFTESREGFGKWNIWKRKIKLRACSPKKARNFYQL